MSGTEINWVCMSRSRGFRRVVHCAGGPDGATGACHVEGRDEPVGGVWNPVLVSCWNKILRSMTVYDKWSSFGIVALVEATNTEDYYSDSIGIRTKLEFILSF